MRLEPRAPSGQVEPLHGSTCLTRLSFATGRSMIKQSCSSLEAWPGPPWRLTTGLGPGGVPCRHRLPRCSRVRSQRSAPWRAVVALHPDASRHCAMPAPACLRRASACPVSWLTARRSKVLPATGRLTCACVRPGRSSAAAGRAGLALAGSAAYRTAWPARSRPPDALRRRSGHRAVRRRGSPPSNRARGDGRVERLGGRGQPVYTTRPITCMQARCSSAKVRPCSGSTSAMMLKRAVTASVFQRTIPALRTAPAPVPGQAARAAGRPRTRTPPSRPSPRSPTARCTALQDQPVCRQRGWSRGMGDRCPGGGGLFSSRSDTLYRRCRDLTGRRAGRRAPPIDLLRSSIRWGRRPQTPSILIFGFPKGDCFFGGYRAGPWPVQVEPCRRWYYTFWQ